MTRVGDSEIAVIIREVNQSPSQHGITSFPTQGVKDYRSYLESPLVQLEQGEGEEQEEGWTTFGSDWDAQAEEPDLNEARRVVPSVIPQEEDPDDDA